MRIALLVSALESGGAERVAATLANAWAARGDQVALIATYPHATASFFHVDPTVQLTFMSQLAGGGPRYAKPRRLLALRTWLRAFRPDIAVAFLTNVSVSTIVALAGTGIPVIACERIDPQFPVPRSLDVARRLTYRFADMVTVQTEALHARLGGRWLGCPRIRVVPNPVPPDLLSMRPVLSDGRREAPVAVAVGRLAEQKQFGRLIETFLGAAPAQWQLRIYGEGPDRGALGALIEDRGAQARVQLMGAVTDLWQRIEQADAFLLSSQYEGFPNALLEAMALGLPCVTFDCPSGPREISRDGEDALLVPAGDWSAFGTAIGRLAADSALRARLGQAAACSVRARYGLDAVLATWDRLFTEIGRSPLGAAR